MYPAKVLNAGAELQGAAGGISGVLLNVGQLAERPMTLLVEDGVDLLGGGASGNVENLLRSRSMVMPTVRRRQEK